MSEIADVSGAYKSAKAIKKGWKLWCMWSKDQPMTNRLATDDHGFVVHTTADMRRMAMDLLAMADAVEEIESLWEE